jgi:hypothetical protein
LAGFLFFTVSFPSIMVTDYARLYKAIVKSGQARQSNGLAVG